MCPLAKIGMLIWTTAIRLLPSSLDQILLIDHTTVGAA